MARTTCWPDRGCRDSQVAARRGSAAPHRALCFYEIYDDEAAHKAHGESAQFQAYGFGDAIPRLESRERVFYETLS
ncbi:MAG: hypothetical protein EXQ81_11015 [Thermoleophilia bacterium]|nr:hypothetical protein [Thermoleophilia bacterium]